MHHLDCFSDKDMLGLAMIMKTKLNILLVAGLLLFMQYSLFQHELSHTFYDHDHHDHEMEKECHLCLNSHSVSQYIFPVNINVSLSLITVLVLFFYSFVSLYSPTLQRPRNRAPPVIFL
jgi:hypothetical protein